MERARYGEDNDDLAQPLPPMGDPAEDLPDLDEFDTQATPGYLTLEIDVSDLQGLAADADPPSSPLHEGVQEYQEPVVEASDLEMLEGLDSTELALPGYLTLEVDFKALEDESPEQPPGDLEYRGRPGQP